MRAFYHGLYLVAAEDIGMRTTQSPAGWPASSDKSTAETWLATWQSDPDLSADTRVCVPIYADPVSTRMWGTLGIRLCNFYVSYAVPPKIRYLNGEGWMAMDTSECDTAEYLIPILEFGEFQLKGSHTLTRQEFRSICDRYSTKEAILKALNAD